MNMKEVAKLAGVSTSTVSKVINGKDKDISEKTRKKVLEIVESSNYVPYLKYLEKETDHNRETVGGTGLREGFSGVRKTQWLHRKQHIRHHMVRRSSGGNGLPGRV